jgi:GAF domain-containing protein
MSAALGRFRASYAETVRRQVADPGEAPLRQAYELGRAAVREDLSVLDLAAVHHDVLVNVLDEYPTADVAYLTRAAGDVFRESLSAFEMVRRGYREARDTVLLQRRQAVMVRQLSTFLADASLALDATDSLDELLRLVAEEGRELVDATCCVMTIRRSTRRNVVRAVTCEDDQGSVWTAFATALERDAANAGSTVPWRLEEDELTGHPALPSAPADLGAAGAPSGWLAAPLAALDGRVLGSIHLFDKRDGRFSEVDEAIVLHLAQMASAALERALLYRAGLPSGRGPS